VSEFTVAAVITLFV